MLISKYVISIPAALASLSCLHCVRMTWLGNEVDWWPQNWSSCPLDYEKLFLLSLFFDEHLTWDQMSRISETSIHVPLLQSSLSSVFQLCSYQFSDLPAKPLATFHDFHYWYSRKNEQPDTLVKVLPTGRISLQVHPMWGYSSAVVPCLLLSSVSISCRTTCKSNSFFPK